MLFTAICTRSEVDEILANLTIEKNKFTLIRNSTSHQSEIIFNESLTGISIDYFHGGLCDNERETAMNNWKSNHMQIMVATSAFEMEINLNNILVVIHAEAPMSITNLIQEAGRAGRDGNTATHVIFFSKKDICTNYSIIAEYREHNNSL
ncbi:unnamed protein product [Rhizophagus irregularis]|nr:unnamed protein product [Rhizophagus irregularis]